MSRNSPRPKPPLALAAVVQAVLLVSAAHADPGAATQVERVVIKGQAMSREASAASRTVIDAERIRDSFADQPEQLLRQVPGVDVRNYGLGGVVNVIPILGFGGGVQLVPQKNPATLRAGEALPVRVLINGQPLAGAAIEVGNGEDITPEDKIVRHTTDASGTALVTLLPSGLNVIVVGTERPDDGSLLPKDRVGGADRLALVATFSFVRP